MLCVEADDLERPEHENKFKVPAYRLIAAALDSPDTAIGNYAPFDLPGSARDYALAALRDAQASGVLPLVCLQLAEMVARNTLGECKLDGRSKKDARDDTIAFIRYRLDKADKARNQS